MLSHLLLVITSAALSSAYYTGAEAGRLDESILTGVRMAIGAVASPSSFSFPSESVPARTACAFPSARHHGVLCRPQMPAFASVATSFMYEPRCQSPVSCRGKDFKVIGVHATSVGADMMNLTVIADMSTGDLHGDAVCWLLASLPVGEAVPIGLASLPEPASIRLLRHFAPEVSNWISGDQQAVDYDPASDPVLCGIGMNAATDKFQVAGVHTPSHATTVMNLHFLRNRAEAVCIRPAVCGYDFLVVGEDSVSVDVGTAEPEPACFRLLDFGPETNRCWQCRHGIKDVKESTRGQHHG